MKAETSMEANRAALPKPPKYPTTPQTLFAQLREMGVSCVSCRDGRPWCDMLVASEKEPEDFLCTEWEGK